MAGTKRAKSKASTIETAVTNGLRSRIVGHDRVSADELLANPFNHRRHGKRQQKVVSASLDELGVVKSVQVNRTTGHILDGHERIRDAKSRGAGTLIDVEYVELSEEEERKALLVLDASVGLATIDADAMDELLEEVQTSSKDLLRWFDQLEDGIANKVTKVDRSDIDAPAKVDQKGELRLKWGTAPGDLWGLGDHRLICGDCTDGSVVARLFAGQVPGGMVTDPPYDVQYDPEWRNKAGVSSTKRLGKVANDHRSSWARAWMHFPGDVAYVWHAGAYATDVDLSLQSLKFKVHAQIIWVKHRAVMSRCHYHWRHEPCQPAGTMVDKVVERKSGSRRSVVERVPIETLQDGDYVVSWNGTVVKQRGAAVKVTSRHYVGEMHEVHAGGQVTKATHSHHWTIRLTSAPKWVVYLMKRGDRWRVGMAKTFNSRGFGPSVRLADEKGDAVWVLSVHDSLLEARIYEQAISVRYGIPTTHWTIDKWTAVSQAPTCRNLEAIELLYELVGPLEAKAHALLAAYGRHPDLPLAIRGDVFSRKTTTIVRSCNLIPGLMEVPKPTGAARKSDPNAAGREAWEWVPVESVAKYAFSGLVYSLDVSRDHHYIADGLVTHNCFYVVREGATAAWASDRRQNTIWADIVDSWKASDTLYAAQVDAETILAFNADATTVWEIKPSGDQDRATVHGTQKPTECHARGMRHHSHGIWYDPFGGSGTGIIAAEQEEKQMFMVELDPDYVAVILERYENATGVRPVRLD